MGFLCGQQGRDVTFRTQLRSQEVSDFLSRRPGMVKHPAPAYLRWNVLMGNFGSYIEPPFAVETCR